jgi:hypothetical protein
LAKFTIILEFGVGTYIRQVRAASAQGALKKIGSGKHGKAVLFRMLSKDKPVGIMGIDNCWCCTAVLRDKLALVNIVKTAE